MLTNRQTLLLQIIIDEFIQNAQPIGSQLISKKKPFQISSATIRNEMADLEEQGFIEKTHTSSGRVPSQKGYRYYVDHLLMPRNLRQDEISRIQSLFAERMNEVEKVVENTAQILSELTDYTSIVLGPNVAQHRLKRIQFVEVDALRVLAVMITDSAHVENRIFHLQKPVSGSELEKMANFLSERLKGVPLTELPFRIQKEISLWMKQHIESVNEILERIQEVFTVPTGSKLFIGGKANLFRQPEFHDIDQIQKLLHIIDEEEKLHHMIRSNGSGIQVYIGRENPEDAMENCSLITATYSFGANQLGTIAILGPTRMNYARVIPVVRLLSQDLSITMKKHYGDSETER